MDDIAQLLKATIQTKVIEAFNQTPEMVEKLIQAAFAKEVNEGGGTPSYHDKKLPFMDWLVGEEIRRATVECVREYVKENKPRIAAKVKESLESGNMMAPVSETIAKILSEEFTWSVEMKIQR